MSSLIVTLTNKKRSFVLDVELPSDVPVAKLKSDLYEALNAYNSTLNIDQPENFSLLCSRNNTILDPEHTLAEAGVWNGDYLLISDSKA